MTILLNSHYVQLWSAHFTKSISTKKHCFGALRKFDEYLIYCGFQGTLDFDRFHADRAYPDRFLPIQSEFLKNFFQYLVEEKHVSATVHSHTVTSLKNFFSFLYDSELISQNPLSTIPTPKHEKKIMNTALSNDEIQKLMKVAQHKDPFLKKYWCLIVFMLETGLRAEELCSLKRKHVNLAHQTVYVYDESKSEANNVVMSIKLRTEILRYVTHPNYLKYCKNGDEYLFPHRGRRMSSVKLRRLLGAFSRDAGLTRIVKPHDLRRTTAYLMQKAGIHHYIISRQLRHKQISTTLYYLPPLREMSEILDQDIFDLDLDFDIDDNVAFDNLAKIQSYFDYEE